MQAPWKYIDQILTVLRDEPPEGPPEPTDDSEVVMPIPMASTKKQPPVAGEEGTADDQIDMG